MVATVVVFEGIDGAGKTTAAARLVDILRVAQLKVATFRFPDRADPETGPVINRHLSGAHLLTAPEFHAMCLKNRENAQPKLRQAVADNDVVVIDRYTWSGHAYAMADGVMVSSVPQLGHVAPDYTIFLRIRPADAMTRLGRENLETPENMTNLCKVAETYESVLSVQRVDGRGVLTMDALTLKRVDMVAFAAGFLLTDERV